VLRPKTWMSLNERLIRKDGRKGLAQGGPMQQLGAPLSGLSPCANTRTPQVSRTRGQLLGPERLRKPNMARIDVDVICVAGHELHHQFRLERLDLARKIDTCHAVDQTKVASGWSRASSPMRF
jgi:hypothetical protein